MPMPLLQPCLQAVVYSLTLLQEFFRDVAYQFQNGATKVNNLNLNSPRFDGLIRRISSWYCEFKCSRGW